MNAKCICNSIQTSGMFIGKKIQDIIMKEEKKKGSLFENTFLTEKSTFTILNNILKTIPTPPLFFLRNSQYTQKI